MQIESFLNKLTGQAIVGITAITDVSLLGGKKNPMKGRVTKKMTNGNCMLFCNSKSNGYENMVKRRLQKEGANPENFKLGNRVWGERVNNTPFVQHNDQKYLEVIFLNSPNTEYFLDGESIEKKDIEGLNKKELAHDDSGQGGLLDKVVIRTYKFDSIQAIKWNGETLEK